MTIQGLERRQVELEMEIERLHRADSLANDLPYACVDDLISEERIRHVKHSALQDALNKLKDQDKDRNSLIDKIEDLEQRQKSAYLRLYEKVGAEIDTQRYKTLGQREKDIQDEQERMKDMSASQIALNNLRE